MRITVIGCGGVGSNIALKLAMVPDVDYIVLVDDDIVDEKYLERVPLVRILMGELAIDEYKVRVLANAIRILRNDISVKPIVGRFPEVVAGEGNYSYVPPAIICVDSMEARKEIESFLKKAGAKFYHVGFDNHRLTIYTSIDEVIEVQERRPAEGSSYETPPTAIELDIAASYVVNELLRIIEVIEE